MTTKTVCVCSNRSDAYPVPRAAYIRLDADLAGHLHPDCGCRLLRNLNTGGVSLYQCPTHAAAPEMAEALVKAEENFDDAIHGRHIRHNDLALSKARRALLRRIE